PLLFLALPGLMYVWAMEHGTSPIYVPLLKPFTHYNTRYGSAVLPLLALAAAALVACVPTRARAVIALLVVIAAAFPWIAHPSPAYWLTCEESRLNSEGRRALNREAAEFLRPLYHAGAGILTVCGDLSGLYREMRIPLRETFTCDNGLPFEATV